MTLFFNGINGTTGSYLIRGLNEEDISRVAQGDTLDEAHLAELVDRHAKKEIHHLGVKGGVDPGKLDQAGWGIIFAHADGEEVKKRKEAIKPLLDLRKEQAGDLYKEFEGVHAVRPNESKIQFLARNNVGPGPAEPEKIPYYLLILASPESIPFRFQYQLGVQYAVGRVHFDTIQEYANYAASVVAAEKGSVTRSRQVTLFGVENEDDKATIMSSQQLVLPLAKAIAKNQPNNKIQWQIETKLRDETKKADLKTLLSRDNGAALLFTASHGIGFLKNDERQIPHQGALLCRDWPGPLKWKERPIPEDYYFSADDVQNDFRIAGIVTFHFACYGAGTPLKDDFAHRAFKERLDITRKPFIAHLPQKMLGHPKGGAIAAIGHVERAWSYSFNWPQAGPQIGAFESALSLMMQGSTVGLAMECFGEKYAELSTELNIRLEDIKFGGLPNDSELALLWTANNDARSYVIVGDPAVRLAVV